MFKYAIVRKPAESALAGLTSVDLGVPDFDLLLSQWQNYVDTLQQLGLAVTQLDALGDFPDAYFVEDPAIIVPEIAVMMRSGAQSRRGEPEHIIEAVNKFRRTQSVIAPGTIDGGDVLISGKHCMVGLSARTNRDGAEQVSSILAQYGYRTDIVAVPEALHFKSNVNFLDARTMLTTQTGYSLDCINDYRKFVVPEGEEYAANVVAINDHILVPEGFDGTIRLLQENAYQVIPMPVSEIQKMDGGLTCLSLRITCVSSRA